VQNRYAGDVGDFLKLGLLRYLAKGTQSGGTSLRIGLNWYLAPDEAHNADGKHIGYLDPGNRWHASLAALDPELMSELAQVVRTGRSVAALNTSGALPEGASAYSQQLEPPSGIAGRQSWHAGALDALARADVVFADPDNGIRSSVAGGKLHKFALINELADYARRGQSLIAYHHADRSAPAEIQAARRLNELALGAQQEPIGAVIARRGTCRFFLATAAAGHRDELTQALSAFTAKWRPHVTLAVS
jgi:hypothetical protein